MGEVIAGMTEKGCNVDAVILGSGAAGMMAGLVVAKSGCSCVILEKGNNIAVSNGARAGGPALAGTCYQQEENAVVTSEQLYQHMYRFSRGTVNAVTRHFIVDGKSILFSTV